MGEFAGNVAPLRQDLVQIVPPHPSEPIMWRPIAPTSERSGSLTRMRPLSKMNLSVMKESLTPHRRDREDVP
jgi:hypothetical protein